MLFLCMIFIAVSRAQLRTSRREREKSKATNRAEKVFVDVSSSLAEDGKASQAKSPILVLNSEM